MQDAVCRKGEQLLSRYTCAKECFMEREQRLCGGLMGRPRTVQGWPLGKVDRRIRGLGVLSKTQDFCELRLICPHPIWANKSQFNPWALDRTPTPPFLRSKCMKRGYAYDHRRWSALWWLVFGLVKVAGKARCSSSQGDATGLMTGTSVLRGRCAMARR